MKRSTLPNKKNQEIFPQGECSFHHEQIIESTPFNKKKKHALLNIMIVLT
jgi:hypothetical protein